MSNMFENVNLNVKSHKTLVSSKLPGHEASMFSIYSQMKKDKSEDVRLESYEHQNQEYDNMQRLAMSASSKTFHQSYLPNLSNKIYMEGLEVIFKDIISNIYLESLYLDDDFKNTQKDGLVAFVYEYVDENGGYSILKNALNSNPTPLLNKIKAVCEGCSRTSAQRKVQGLKEACNNGNSASEIMEGQHKFEMNDDEIKDYLSKRDNLSQDEIAEFVKAKVLDVIKDEKQRQVKEEEFEEKLNQEIDSLNIEDDEKKEKAKQVAKEGFNMKYNKNKYVDMTLFEAIQCATMKEAINAAHIVQCNDINDEGELGQTDDDEHEDHQLPEDDDDILGEDDIIKENSIDMDVILAESISKYTMLEVFNTLKLKKFTRENVMKMTIDLSK